MKYFPQLAFFFLFTATSVFSQIDLPYQIPHKDILALADSPLPPSINLSFDGTKTMMLYRDQYKSIEEMSENEIRLGGLRINPKTNSSSRASFINKITLFDQNSKQEFEIQGMPNDPRISNIQWSNSQEKIAFTNTVDDGVELWIIDYAAKKATRVTEAILNANLGSPYYWLANDTGFVVKFLPKDRKPLIDTNVQVPGGPIISINEEGQKAQNRTYQDLLKNATDETNFQTLLECELWMVDITGKGKLWKEKAMYRNVSTSPDGTYFLVSEIKRPFSYIVPYSRFPTSFGVYNVQGKLLKNLVNIPLIEELPQGNMAVQTGIRSISWRDDKPATLFWAEALDKGNPEIEVPYRDEIFSLEAPFTGHKKSIVKTKLRFSGIRWGNGNTAIVYENWWNTRTQRIVFFNPNNPNEIPYVFSERNYQDQYSNPGTFSSTRNLFGKSVLEIDNDNNMYLIGEGYSEEGKLPFVDKYNITSKTTERLYKADVSNQLESIVRILDTKKGIVLTRLESSNEFPNFYLRNIQTKELTALTSFQNPFKAIQDVYKEVITYQREDGLELSATLYLPVGYDPDKKEKMPMIMWAYPREFKDRQSASQVTKSSNQFTYPSYGSPIYWVNRGYVILDDVAFPIVGEGDEEPNDTFVEQLVSNAKAAIDAVDKLGYIDRNRIAVGGHSYGAFMTANLLSYSNLFAAGIARSGAYNRTLTPFGFQSEERNYWEAPEVYNAMSPFQNAEKMKTPMLLIHGEADNNSGTYPMQSERYFNALKGLGAPVRLVILPKESHGYSARESILHMLWEQDEWLEKHVKSKDK